MNLNFLESCVGFDLSTSLRHQNLQHQCGNTKTELRVQLGSVYGHFILKIVHLLMSFYLRGIQWSVYC